MMFKIRNTLLIAIILAVQSLSAEELTSQKQQYSYAIGAQVAQMLRTQQVGELDIAVFAQAVDDILSNKPTRIDDVQMRAALRKHYSEVKAKRAETAEKNMADGAAYLEKNGKRNNVVTQESGLQYEVVKPGEGKSPKKSDQVEVHYQGELLDGTVFDSSVKRGKPATFSLDQVIPGFREALSMMKPGAKWKIAVPHQLAYGERGAGKKIGPNETLIFELELIKVIEKSSPAQE